MKPIPKLIGKAALLATPFLLLLAVSELWTGWDRSVYAQKKDAFTRAASQVEVLVLGSSQSYYGVDPGAIEPSTFNLAFPGQSLRYDAALLHSTIDRLPRLRVVLIPISFFTLEYELSLGLEARRACNYRYHFGVPNESPEHREEARNYFNFLLSGRQQWAGLIRERLRSALGRAGTKSEGIEYLDARGGLLPAAEPSPTPEELKREAPVVMRMHLAGMHPKVTPRNVALLASLQRELAARSIRLVLFTPPVSQSYAALIEPERGLQWRGALRGLTSALGVPYRDYLADPRFSDADFRDCNHLNQKGRRKLTDSLQTDLIQPALRTP